MIIKKEISQNTEEWLEWRKTKIGASDAPIIMGKSPWKTPQQLYEEKLGIVSSNFENAAMTRGKALEPYALKQVQEELQVKLSPQVCVSKEHDYIIASLDGLSECGKISVEIKCPGKKTHQMAIKGKIPDHYQIQMQHQMYVTESTGMYYYSYDGNDGILIMLNRDQKFIDQMVDIELEFYDCLVDEHPPIDKKERTDERWAQWAKAWKEIQREKKILEQKEKECRETLISMSEGYTYGQGVKVAEIEKKGTIEYSKIPVLNSINLEKYRKKSTKYWKITTS